MKGESPPKIPKKIWDFYTDLWSYLGFLHSGLLRSGILHSGKVRGANLWPSKKLTCFELHLLGSARTHGLA